jgi:uncharacterized membrane protein YesL
MMRTVLRIVGGAFQDLWADLWTVLACNLLWLIANLLIIPGPPATLGIVQYTNRLAHGEEVDFADFFKAFRRSWGLGWRWGAVNLAVVVFLVADIALTDQYQATTWSPLLQGLYVTLLIFWLMVQLFALPFLFEQEHPSVWQAMRNGAVLIGRNLSFSMALSLLVLIIMIVGTFAFLLSAMFGATFLACVGNRAVLNRLEESRLAGSTS